ncbi:related to serine-type carboxypeptidase Z precursor [Fusarium torulosum]|uniref:Related to serine-type carboxypeptidase Z n=1 Tax=Fusarium torulosum TaxID=33205 RepID=A0AAE8M106_9HYPO|nr:related to serine-type carboxypeptidase Z precursor [Fusarium torulosum]
MKVFSAIFLLATGLTASAQSFVSPPKNIKTVLSEKFKGASISYKRVNNVCETTKGVNSYSGYVHLPSYFVPDAGGAKGLPKNGSTNYFFWYFPARNEPQNAPTAMYFGGGPGYSGFDGSSVFPCYFNSDSNSTTLNKHSWNNNVNMIYIDNPSGVGFSYTTLANGTLDTMTNTFEPVYKNNTSMESITDVGDLKETGLSKIPATMHVTDPSTTINGTMAAASTIWRFSQVWFSEFPEHRTKNKEISIWGVSYAGFYTTMFTTYFLQQNKLIRDGKHEIKEATELNMKTVGIINGMTDIEPMVLGWLDYAMNNTYDHPIIDEKAYKTLLTSMTDPKEGCFTLLHSCRAAQARGDPEMKGNNPVVNKACAAASVKCLGIAFTGVDNATLYYPFDISVKKPGAFPYEYEAAFFNQEWVQQELGVPLNYTRGNDQFPGVFFEGTGDPARYDLSHLGKILDSGLNVAMVYGDRDYRCDWFSAENASLHIPFNGAKAFANAGYADIITNSSYKGGLVREHAGLSFSRVFQAGHSAGGFQPETVSRIFERAMFRNDVATGKVELTKMGNYQTKGKLDVRDVRNKLPASIKNVCYVLQPAETCTKEQKAALVKGTAETKDWVVTSPK